MRPMAPRGHTQSLPAAVPTANDTNELAIVDVDSSLSFRIANDLSRHMAPLGLTPPLQDNLAGGDDLEELAINEADCSLSVVSSTILSRHEASVGVTQIARLISESDNSSRVDARGEERTRRCGMRLPRAIAYDASRLSSLLELTAAPPHPQNSSPHPDSGDAEPPGSLEDCNLSDLVHSTPR